MPYADRIINYSDRPTLALPPEVAARLTHLQDKLTDLQALARAAGDDEVEANATLKSARVTLGNIKATKHPKGPTAEMLEAAQRAVEQAKETADRLRDRSEARQSRANVLGNLVSTINTFLKRANHPLEAHPPGPAETSQG